MPDQRGARGGQRRVEVVLQIAPARADFTQQRQRVLHAVFQQFGAGNLVGVVAAAKRQVAAREERLKLVGQLELVLDRQLDVDALDAVGVLAHAWQRDHHVFIDLEGVGMARDGGSARAVEPELLAGLGAHGDEALAALAVGHTDHFRGGAGHGVLVVTDDIADQHHLRERVALALGGVAHRAQIAFVQMLQTCQNGAALALRLAVEEVLDFDDARNRIARLAKELQADRAHMLRHPVQDPARAGDDAVATFLLHARQAGQELVGDVLAQTFLAELAAFDRQRLGAQHLLARLAVAVRPLQLERGHRHVVDLAEVVVHPGDLEPVALGIDHAPPRQVVQRGTPQHGLLAACVHRHVAADARCVDRGRVDREHQPGLVGGIGHAARDHAGAGEDRRHLARHAGQIGLLDFAKLLQLFRIDDGRKRRQRHGAAGVPGAASARDDGETQFETALHQARDLFLGIRGQHHERVLDAPVGGVGHVRDARESVELDVVVLRHLAQHALGALAQRVRVGEFLLEGLDRLLGERDQLLHTVRAIFRGGLGVLGTVGGAALFDFAQAVVQRAHQHLAALGIFEQVVLQVRVAAHDPDIAEHLVEHPRRAAGAAFPAQFVQDAPGFLAEQADNDLAIRK